MDSTGNWPEVKDITRTLARWLIANPVNVFATQHPYLTKSITGIPVIDIFYAAGFVRDSGYMNTQSWKIHDPLQCFAITVFSSIL